MNLDNELDKYLKIKTTGRDDSNSNYNNFPYEATPYIILEELTNSGYITRNDYLIDYGCGKGRVDFYLANYTKCKMIGIEYDDRLYNNALNNLCNFKIKTRINFIKCYAEEYEVNDNTTGAYFFNPFSIDILSVVFENIRKSLKRKKREFKLFFYFPSDKYLKYLSDNNIKIMDKIDCSNHFKTDKMREYILYCKL